MSLGRILGRSFIFLVAFSLSFLIIYRDLNLPDDYEYLKMFYEINNDFHGASEKYGLVFKTYMVFVGSVLGLSVLVAFALIPAMLAFIFFALGRGHLAFGFAAVIMSMPVVWFVQLRQALALVFVIGLVLAGRKFSKYFFSILACLSHLSVLPFVVWYLTVVDSRFLLFKNKALSVTLSLLFILFVFIFIENIDFFSSYTGFPFNILIGDEALFYGRLGVGLVLIFYFHAVFVGAYGLVSQKVMFSMLSFGSAMFLLSFYMPLLQRILLPFVLYLVILFYSSSRVDVIHKLTGFCILGPFFLYKCFELLMG